MHLLEALGVHEVVIFAVVVEVFHLLLVEGNALDLSSDENRCSIMEPLRRLRILA